MSLHTAIVALERYFGIYPKDNVNLAISYKNFAAFKGISHIGLGVAAVTNTKVLTANGYKAQIWPTLNNVDIVNNLKAAEEKGEPITHLVISAPWLSTYDLSCMCRAFPRTQFVVVSHSNFGFLQADPSGLRLLREGADLSVSTHNFHIGGNSRRFVSAFRNTFGKPALYMPNMYYVDPYVEVLPRTYHGGTLLIGCFGAVRPLKNTITAATAALQIARRTHAQMEFWISGGRFEGGGDVVLRTVQQLFANLPNARLVQAAWAPWGTFRTVVRHMHLMMQVSYTESFNMVTADGVAEGVPSVVSSAIEWAPDDWKAEVDDVDDVARVGLQLLRGSRYEVKQGLKALRDHTSEGLKAWERFMRR